MSPEKVQEAIVTRLNEVWDKTQLDAQIEQEMKQEAELLNTSSCPGEAELLIKLFALWPVGAVSVKGVVGVCCHSHNLSVLNDK